MDTVTNYGTNAPATGVAQPNRVSSIAPAVAVPVRAADRRPVMVKRVSWEAILAGTVAAISIQILLTILGLAVGLTSANAADVDAQGMGMGAGVWWLVSGLVSLFIGGFIAARLAGVPRDFEGCMHGFITWCTVNVLSALFVTTALGSMVLGTANAASDAAAAADDTTINTNAPAGTTGGAVTEPLTEDSDVTAEDVGETVGNVADRAASAVTDPNTREQAMDAVTAAPWWSFAALALGAAVATFGGKAGRPKSWAEEFYDRTEDNRRDSRFED